MDASQRFVGSSGEPLLPMREVERRHILHVLQVTGGNRTEAARILGLDRKTLYRKLRRYGYNVIEPEPAGSAAA